MTLIVELRYLLGVRDEVGRLRKAGVLHNVALCKTAWVIVFALRYEALMVCKNVVGDTKNYWSRWQRGVF
jgi:hypothetical protein